MVQTQLGEYTHGPEIQALLDRLRNTEAVLWFPHDDQQVVIKWYPDSHPAGYGGEDPAEEKPWIKSICRSAMGHRLTTPQVLERIRADAEQFQAAVVPGIRCGTCLDPVPKTETIVSDQLPERFCSTDCLHEMEYEFGEPLTPTVGVDEFTHPLHFASWTAQNADRVDAHLQRVRAD